MLFKFQKTSLLGHFLRLPRTPGPLHCGITASFHCRWLPPIPLRISLRRTTSEVSQCQNRSQSQVWQTTGDVISVKLCYERDDGEAHHSHRFLCAASVETY